MEKFDSRLVARYIIYRAKQLDMLMNFTKTHKLLYILDGMFLFLHHRDFINESPRAWQYGPAYPKVQDMMKKTSPQDLGDFEPEFEKLEKETGLKFLTTRILERFGNCTSKELTDWSHKRDSPWDTTCQENPDNCSAVINKQIIGDYFKNTFEPVNT